MALFQNLSWPDVTRSSAGLKSVYKPKVGGVRFADLLDQVSSVDPEVTFPIKFEIKLGFHITTEQNKKFLDTETQEKADLVA